jgi:hypothetical protein
MGERHAMRRLIYVPIIHTDPELGSLAEGIEERAKAVVGSSNLQKHKEVVRLYWQAIADYWEEKNVSGLKIFQDGIAADGMVGKNIVKSLADKGSINHKIIEQLMEKGAELIKTEDPELLKEEYFLTRELIERKSLLGSLWALVRYRSQKDKLLKARDTYIVKRIDESLGEGETGVCFLGAYHQLLPNLPKDIEVITLKDPQKVREYYQKFMSKRWEKEVDDLGTYLMTPITIELGEKND